MSEIVVKGEQDGLVIVLPAHETTDKITMMLREHFEKAGAFFKPIGVTLDLGEGVFSEEALKVIGEVLAEWQMDIRAVRASDEESRSAARLLNIPLPFVPSPSTVPEQVALEIPEDSVPALVIPRTLRSGQMVSYPATIVVLGDVNPGAEIVAGGDIVVWGSLRGLVHAGAGGDNHAIVCALQLSTTQLRIGTHIAMAPEEKGSSRLRFWKRDSQGPERAFVQNEGIVVEAWPER